MTDNNSPSATHQFGRLLRDPEAPGALQADPEAYLEDFSLPEAIKRAWLSRGSKPLLAYYELVNNRLRWAIRDYIPRVSAELGDERLRSMVGHFVRDCGARSPLLRDVPEEFVRWALPKWREDSELPPYLSDLARFELLDQTVRNDPTQLGEETGTAIDISLPIRCNGTLKIEHYDWIVQDLPPFKTLRDGDELPQPKPGPTCLLAFRGRDEKAHYLTITARAAAMLSKLTQRQSLQQALVDACEESGEALDNEVLANTAVTLAQLSEAGVLLGAEAS